MQSFVVVTHRQLHVHELVTAPDPQVIVCDFNHVFVSRAEESGFT